MAQKRGLGKGLDALFVDNSVSADTAMPEPIRLSEIEPNRDQPRKDFDDEALQQLADSIRENGVIQPLVVRPIKSGGYQLVAGERRWRASRMAGLTEVPVLVLDIDDKKAMELTMIENLQRENLNPMEEAFGYQQLMDAHDLTQDAVAKVVGKSRSAVANTLRLLDLPEAVKALVKAGALSAGHARALLAFEDEEKMLEAAKRAVKDGFSVRELERMAKPAGTKQPGKTVPRNSYYTEAELAIKEELNRRVKVREKGDKGTIEIEFYSKEDFAELIGKLSR